MTILSVSLTGLIFSGFATVLACGSTSAAVNTMTQTTKMVKTTPAYSKPGASIYMSSDYDGMSVSGQVETVNFNLSHSYPGATLTVSVQAPDQIELIKAPQGEQRILSSGATESYELVFAPRGQSIEPINILAILQLADGQQMSRSFSVKVNSTGRAPQKTSPEFIKPVPVQLQRQRQNGNMSISMPMQEEIIKN